MTKRALMLAAAIAAALTPAGGAIAAGGTFACGLDSPRAEVHEKVNGSSTLVSIVMQYMARWDAVESRRQCENFAAGRPFEISCLNGRRDWPAILATVPGEYFGQSDKSLARPYEAEMLAGNGYSEAMDYCRSVGAIK